MAEVRPREAAVVALDELERVVAREATAADVHAGEVGGPPEAVLQELEVVVDPGLGVVEVLVVDEGALDRVRVGLEAVGLGDQGVR